MKLPALEQLELASAEIYQHMMPSPSLQWPLLSERLGCELWVKHENHNPTGAFKVRGGLVYIDRLIKREPGIRGVVTATRGNHGQSIAFAAARHGLRCVVVVPEGNNPDKNLAMRALGAELVIHGSDFEAAVSWSQHLAREKGLHRIPSFHPDLMMGVASYSLEFLRAGPDLRRVYVPIGLGSGICGMVCARNALGLATEIVGVVSAHADAYARSMVAGCAVSSDSANTLADGLAVRVPNEQALAIIRENVARIVTVTDDEILVAMRDLFTDTHNVSEGAGAAALAALASEGRLNREQRVGVVLSGGNVDRALYATALAL